MFADCKSTSEIVELLNDEDVYFKLFRLIAIKLRESLKAYRYDRYIERLFS